MSRKVQSAWFTYFLWVFVCVWGMNVCVKICVCTGLCVRVRVCARVRWRVRVRVCVCDACFYEGTHVSMTTTLIKQQKMSNDCPPYGLPVCVSVCVCVCVCVRLCVCVCVCVCVCEIGRA